MRTKYDSLASTSNVNKNYSNSKGTVFVKPQNISKYGQFMHEPLPRIELNHPNDHCRWGMITFGLGSWFQDWSLAPSPNQTERHSQEQLRPSQGSLSWEGIILYPLVMTNISPWKIDGPNRNRWFTELKNGLDLSMANCECHNQRVYVFWFNAHLWIALLLKSPGNQTSLAGKSHIDL